MSDKFTLDDLRRIMRECAGEDENVDLSGPIGDRGLEDLGYDSLALLEIASRIQREYGIPMSDESIAEMTTPNEAVTYVNKRFATI
ncbi:acyl carrier protein [Paractinoplanes ferrugineus]|uniref:Actinorhodin polyketide synthase acyl carrier protein n=1 Tax=Paractinoplanes ferrugineus TaxID=113564 RepID=A0A919J392_9ACTN|nr:acyl carrier protein [Actinoplanes ferrugineus]GIE13720.1 actinorhodin polyketide synthase acyl carrier protein [Actinoplanes ferrugineus]